MVDNLVGVQSIDSRPPAAVHPRRFPERLVMLIPEIAREGESDKDKDATIADGRGEITLLRL